MPENQDDLYNAVYGKDYESAISAMQVLQQSITQQENIGFKSKEELEEWAHDNLLDNIVFSKAQHRFFNVSHKGELITPQTYQEYYDSILYYFVSQANGSLKPVHWIPRGYRYFNNAKLPGEVSDGTHRPIYYRDYCRPAGYYNTAKGAYNSAKPFPVFAKETGRDTSYIYTYIHAIAGECAPWLLLWLKTKMLRPTVKTQVIPIIVSRTQGTGKSTFGEVICKGLFGPENVLVTDQYDATSRFNADYADALIVCQEEKEETDRKNPIATIKSRATATTIRKELKGTDPTYQESYTEFVITTNKDVPVKFDSPDDQRRFMVMEADGTFTNKNEKAKAIFEKLYGYSSTGEKLGTPFVEDFDLIAQFKHELYEWDETVKGEKIQLRKFPHTAAYEKCYAIPRTTESTEIESIVKALIPFIKASLIAEKMVTEIEGMGDLPSIVQYKGAVEFFPQVGSSPKFVALCRPLVFYDMETNKPYSHAVVERSLLDLSPMLQQNGLLLLPDTRSVPGGFPEVQGRHKAAVSARFALLGEKIKDTSPALSLSLASKKKDVPKRIGTRLRVDKTFRPNADGCYETVNEMKPGTLSLRGKKTEKVAYMDTFLFESDDCTKNQFALEKARADKWLAEKGAGTPIESLSLYEERLSLQLSEGQRLFKEGKVCRLVYSGAKSYHMLVRINKGAQTTEEYSWLHAYLCTVLSDKLVFDSSTSDPARLTRSPLTLERLTCNYGVKIHGLQKLILEDFNHVYTLDWQPLYEQWEARPLKAYESVKGKKLCPTKPIYKSAMESLLDGTYWVNEAFDGQRQETFFPAYRLLRGLGYSHEELWGGEHDIMGNVSSYKHQNEIDYWRSRESSDLILTIDSDFDSMEEPV